MEKAKASDSYQRQMIYNLVVFLVNTGVRPSEYYKIKWKDITIHNQNGVKLLYINVPDNTKTGQRIVVSLPEAYTCYENIKSLSKYTKENDYVFTNYDGTSMKNWTKTYKSKLEEWGLYLDDEDNPRPPYSLRHYYATQRLLDGVQVYDLAKNMGTSVKQIENHYGHVLSTQKTNELIQGAGISSLQTYQESDEYKSAQEEIKALKEKREECESYIQQQNDMVQFKQMSKRADDMAESVIREYDEGIEQHLKNMDEKALKEYRLKLVKVAKKNKLHPEIYDETIARVDYYLSQINRD